MKVRSLSLLKSKDKGRCTPSKIKNNDGFHPVAIAGQTLRNFSGFFHPHLVGLVARGSCAKKNASLKTSTAMKRTKTMCTEIRIYIADLAAYNNGKLHGVWIDATQDLDDIQGQIQKMLAASPEEFSEEYAIHDYEGFNGYGLSEYEGIERVQEIACFIEEHPDIAGELLNYFGGDLEDSKKAIEENYCGCYQSLADYAQELTEGTAEIPENLAFYIDYERMGRDMELGGDVYTIETAFDEIHIFWSH